MKVMNLGNEDEPAVKKKKSNTRNLKIALGLAAVILVPTIGSTLAGSITVGTAGAIEFGQGVLTTTACDGDGISVVPVSTLTAGVFNLDTITVSGVASGCADKYFTFKVLSGTTPQAIGTSSATLCKIQFKTGSASLPSATCGTVSGSSSTGFAFTTATTVAASAVDKITLESSSS